MHVGYRRRHEGGIANVRNAGGGNEVLVAPKLAGQPVRSTHALEELGMDLADQTQRERKLREPLESVVHRRDVVHDLVDVPRDLRDARLELDREQIVEGALRAFDL